MDYIHILLIAIIIAGILYYWYESTRYYFVLFESQIINKHRLDMAVKDMENLKYPSLEEYIKGVTAIYANDKYIMKRIKKMTKDDWKKEFDLEEKAWKNHSSDSKSVTKALVIKDLNDPKLMGFLRLGYPKSFMFVKI